MKLPILQSGFIALNEESLIQSEPLSESKFIRSVELGKPVDPSGNAFFYNRDVENLFTAFSKDHRVMASFDYREELLKTALSSFGTPSIEAWLNVQVNSPFLSTLHRRFLNDMYRYVGLGCDREVSVETWLGLISPRQATKKDEATELIFNFKGDYVDPSIHAFIATWTHRDGGFKDLLYFITTVFSKQCIHTL